MSPDQMALTRASRSSAVQPSRATRQSVPAFLNKLYNMVNDPSTDHLIKWSDAGDSFYVFNHEQFAREVLGHWFKHQNFSSFVRQLNMYGFHKVPHLQSGVLRAGSESETWHFENNNFQRGQPDLLCLIQRKKQTGAGGDDDGAAMTATSGHVATNNNNNSVIDVNSIINGITAIKKHQATISADLAELQQSNQLLWQEALAARERYKKHNDTINRILKFLAGVFGATATSGSTAGGNKDSGLSRSPSTGSDFQVVPRKRPRLMISDGRESSNKGVKVVEEEEEEDEQMHLLGADSPKVDRFSTAAAISPMEGTMSGAPSPASIAESAQLSEHVETPKPQPPAQPPGEQAAMIRHNSQTPPLGNNDLLQFASLWNSPESLQRVLQLLNSQQPLTMPPDQPASSEPTGLNPYSYAQGAPQAPLSLEYALPPQDPRQTSGGNLSPNSMALLTGMLPQQGSLITPELAPLADNSARLQKSYKDASEINNELDALASSMDSLMESWGLDPNTVASLKEGGSSEDSLSNQDVIASASESVPPIPAPDFDFDAFLSQDPKQVVDPAQFNFDQFNAVPPGTVPDASLGGAFLDEVNSNSNASSPPPRLFEDASEANPTPLSLPKTVDKKLASKRKSDALSADEELKHMSPAKGTKAKRKR